MTYLLNLLVATLTCFCKVSELLLPPLRPAVLRSLLLSAFASIELNGSVAGEAASPDEEEASDSLMLASDEEEPTCPNLRLS